MPQDEIFFTALFLRLASTEPCLRVDMMGFLVGCGRSRNHGVVFKVAMKLGDICFATRSGWRASASEHFNGGNADLELPVVRQPREKRMMKTVRPLASIWCVKCSTGAAAYVRKLPAAMGLNVIIVKPNEGSPLRHGSLLGPDSDGSALFAYLAAAGRPVSCDLSTEASGGVVSPVDGARILIEDVAVSQPSNSVWRRLRGASPCHLAPRLLSPQAGGLKGYSDS